MPSVAATPPDTQASVGTPGAPIPAPPAWTHEQLESRVRGFLSAIHNGDETAFRGMLSSRSTRHIQEFNAQREIWTVASDALGTIDGLRLRVLGGSRDSVALLIRGQRVVEGDTTAEPLIISLLREEREWKVMYPGLQYPEGHLRR